MATINILFFTTSELTDDLNKKIAIIINFYVIKSEDKSQEDSYFEEVN